MYSVPAIQMETLSRLKKVLNNKKKSPVLSLKCLFQTLSKGYRWWWRGMEVTPTGVNLGWSSDRTYSMQLSPSLNMNRANSYE